MLDHIQLQNLLLFDIETVPGNKEFSELSPAMQQHWEHKLGSKRKEEDTPDDHYFNNAGIYAEFGKVICISAGYFHKGSATSSWKFKITSIAYHSEEEVLKRFAKLLDEHYADPNRHLLCGHNIKEFDVPYLCRRMLVNGVDLPNTLNIAGKKPWEVKHVDTMELWKFGDYKNYTKLSLLTDIFNIPTPKDDIDGSDVGRVYWKEDDLKRITHYCQKDVLAVAQLLLRFKGLPLLEEANISYA